MEASKPTGDWECKSKEAVFMSFQQNTTWFEYMVGDEMVGGLVAASVSDSRPDPQDMQYGRAGTQKLYTLQFEAGRVEDTQGAYFNLCTDRRKIRRRARQLSSV